jgi:hypothetical protein
MEVSLVGTTVQFKEGIKGFPMRMDCELGERWYLYIDIYTPGHRYDNTCRVPLKVSPLDSVLVSTLGIYEYFIDETPPREFIDGLEEFIIRLNDHIFYMRDGARSLYESALKYVRLLKQLKEIEEQLKDYKVHYTEDSILKLRLDYIKWKSISDIVGLPDDSFE